MQPRNCCGSNLKLSGGLPKCREKVSRNERHELRVEAMVSFIPPLPNPRPGEDVPKRCTNARPRRRLERSLCLLVENALDSPKKGHECVPASLAIYLVEGSEAKVTSAKVQLAEIRLLHDEC